MNLLDQENLFIRLYRQGKRYDEFANEIGIDPEIVLKWQNNLESADEASNDDEILASSVVTGKNSDGKYTYRQSLKVKLDSVEMLKFSLWRLSANKAKLDDMSPEVRDYVETAIRCSPYVNQHLTQLKIDKGQNLGEYSYNYSIDDDDEQVSQNVKEAIELFIKTTLIPNDYGERFKIIKSTSNDTYQTLSNCLPYCIKQISIKQYLGIENTRIERIPIDCQWVFVTGENGYGKTSFLQAIAIGLQGSIDDGVNLVEENPYIGLEFKYNNIDVVNNVGSSQFKEFEYLLCYGPSRLQVQPRMNQNDINKQSTTTYNLFNSDGVLLNIESSLIIWHLDNKRRYEEVKNIFKKVVPTLSDIIIKKNQEDDYDVLYIEHQEDNLSQTYSPLPFQKLASGLRSVMAMVGDILIRLIRKHPSINDLSELSGIILIDELENHLHPKWQYKLPSLLSEAFPKVQFIVTTHSVIPVLGSPPSSQFLKLTRHNNRITVDKLQVDISNLLPNSILTSPIFDMNTIFPVSNENISDIRTEDSYQEVLSSDAIDKNLKDFDEENKNLPDSLFD